MQSLRYTSSARLAWAGMLAAAVLVLALAWLPPWLPEPARQVVMQAFAPACHQIPARSPHVAGTPIAICDRCTGIYAGLVLGILTVPVLHRTWRGLGRNDRLVLLGSLVPLGMDWIAPMLHLWPNTPATRAATGLAFGAVAASFVAHRVLQGMARRE